MSKRIRLYGLMTLAVAFAFSLAFVGNVNAADLTVGNLTVTNDAHFQWPIYADGNLIKFKNGNPNYGAMIDFGSGNSSIYDKGDLHIATDDNMYFDFSNQTKAAAYVNGKLFVQNNLVANYPIYATGNEIVFNGSGVVTKPDDGIARIYKDVDGSLRISDHSLYIDVSNTTINSDLIAKDNLYVQDTLYLQNGSDGNSVTMGFDGDYLNIGYYNNNTQINTNLFSIGSSGDIGFDGDLSVDGSVDISDNVDIDGGASIDGDVAIKGNIYNPNGVLDIDDSANVNGAFSQTSGSQVTFSGNIDANLGIDITGAMMLTGDADIRGFVYNSTGDFEINDNAIVEGTLNTQDITPTLDNYYNIGGPSIRYNSGYFGNKVSVGYEGGSYVSYGATGPSAYDTNLFLYSDGSVTANPDGAVYLLPSSHNSYSYNFNPNDDSTWDLGSSSYYWNNEYVNGLNVANNIDVNDGSFTVDSSGNVYTNGALEVDGVATINNDLNVDNIYLNDDDAFNIGSATSRLYDIYMSDNGSLMVGDISGHNYMAYDNHGVNSYGSYNTNISSDNEVWIDPTSDVYISPSANIYLRPSGVTSSYNLEPNSDSTYNLGSNSSAWLNGYFDNTYTNNIDTTSAGNILKIGQNALGINVIPAARFHDGIHVMGDSSFLDSIRVDDVSYLNGGINVNSDNFTVDSSGNVYANGTLEVDGDTTLNGRLMSDSGQVTVGYYSDPIDLKVWGLSKLEGGVRVGTSWNNNDLTVYGNSYLYGNESVNNITPNLDATYNLGSNTDRFSGIYLDNHGGTYVGNVSGDYMTYDYNGVNSFGTLSTTISSMNDVWINPYGSTHIDPASDLYLYPGGKTYSYDIEPDTNSTYDLGSSSSAWANGYFDTLNATDAMFVNGGFGSGGTTVDNMGLMTEGGVGAADLTAGVATLMGNIGGSGVIESATIGITPLGSDLHINDMFDGDIYLGSGQLNIGGDTVALGGITALGFDDGAGATMTAGIVTANTLTDGVLTISAGDLTTTGDLDVGDITANDIVDEGSFDVRGAIYNGAGGNVVVNNDIAVTGLSYLDGGINVNSGLFTVDNLSGNTHTSGTFEAIGAVTGATFNGLALNSVADGFTITGGILSRMLTITDNNVNIDQSLSTIDSPTFNILAVATLTDSVATLSAGNFNTTGSIDAGGTTVTSLVNTGSTDFRGDIYNGAGSTIVLNGDTQVDGIAYLDGGVDRSTASALDLGFTNATAINFAGGYGSTGVTISPVGNLQMNGNLTVGGTSTLTGNVDALAGLDVTGASLNASGAVVNLNASSNYNVNIATGNSSGAVALGNASAGAITLDSGTGISIDSAATSNFTVTGAGADLNLHATGGSIWMRSTEGVAGAVTIDSSGAGGGLAFNGNSGGIVINQDGAGTGILIDSENGLNLNTANNHTINTGTGLFTVGGALTATGLSALNGGIAVNTNNFTVGADGKTAITSNVTAGNLLAVSLDANALTGATTGLNIDLSPVTGGAFARTGMSINANSLGGNATGVTLAGTYMYGIDMNGSNATAEFRMKNGNSLWNPAAGTVNLDATTFQIAANSTFKPSSAGTLTIQTTGLNDLDLSPGSGIVDLNGNTLGSSTGTLDLNATNVTIGHTATSTIIGSYTSGFIGIGSNGGASSVAELINVGDPVATDTVNITAASGSISGFTTIQATTLTSGTASLSSGSLTGATGITSTGNIDFSGATTLRMPVSAAAPSCAGPLNRGSFYFDTNFGYAKVCTDDANHDGTIGDYAWQDMN